MSILIKFNDASTHTFGQIRDNLKMDPKIALAALQAIVTSEILTVTQGTLENGDAVFAINEEFSK